MKINIDWDKGGKKVISRKKKDPEKPINTEQISIKSKTTKTSEKISPDFIESFKYTHTPGKVSIEIDYSLDNQDENKIGVHVKTINREQIQGLKRFLNIFED